MEKELGEIKAVLKKYGQEHLLNNFENLDEAHKKELLKEIKGINETVAKFCNWRISV